MTRPRGLPPTVAAGDESRPFRDRDETSGRAGAPPQFDARQLIGPGGAAEIILDNKIYTLRITKQRKLLLTKEFADRAKRSERGPEGFLNRARIV